MKEVITSIVGDALGKVKEKLKVEYAVTKTEHFTFNLSSDLEVDFIPDSALMAYMSENEFEFSPVSVSLHNLPTYADWAETDYTASVNSEKVMTEFKEELISLLLNQFNEMQQSFTTDEENY